MYFLLVFSFRVKNSFLFADLLSREKVNSSVFNRQSNRSIVLLKGSKLALEGARFQSSYSRGQYYYRRIYDCRATCVARGRSCRRSFTYECYANICFIFPVYFPRTEVVKGVHSRPRVIVHFSNQYIMCAQSYTLHRTYKCS